MRRQAIAFIVCMLPAVGLVPGDAHAVRSFNALSVGTPIAGAKAFAGVRKLGDVDVARVRDAVRRIAEAWNNGDMDRLLLPGFPNRQRLLDTLDQSVPRDARLAVLSVDAISTLGEQEQDQADHGKLTIRTVSAIVSSQIEFDDPVTGHQRLEGRYEWILQFRDSVSE